MSFLAPLYLLGFVALGLPILLHLRTRRPHTSRRFSSLRFFESDPPPMSRSRTPEQWLLLALRLAAIACVVVAFGLPMLNRVDGGNGAQGQGRYWLILIDRSASMNRPGLSERTRAQLQRLADRVEDADVVELALLDGKPRLAIEADEWTRLPPDQRRKQLAAMLDDSKSGWAAHSLSESLEFAAERGQRIAREHNCRESCVVLFSDCQQGGEIDDMRQLKWPDDVALVVSPLQPDETGNASLKILPIDDPVSQGASVYARVTNTADSPTRQLTLESVTRGEAPEQLARFSLAPGETRMIPLSLETTAEQPLIVRVAGDAATFDNEYFHVVPPIPAATVVFWGSDDGRPDGQLYYLERAFAGNPRRRVQVLQQGPGAPAVLTAHADVSLAVAGADLLQSDDPADASHKSLLKQLRDTRRAHAVLVPLVSGCNRELIADVLDCPSLTIEEQSFEEYRCVSWVDFSHRLFASFAQQSFSDFSTMRVRKYRKLAWSPESEQLKILARFENGDPMLVESRSQGGPVYVLTADWRRSDGQLQLSSKFAPLLNAILETDIPSSATKLGVEAIAGDLRSGSAGEIHSVQLASWSQTVPADPDRWEPGLFRFVPDGSEQSRWIGVNVPESESQTEPVPDSVWEQLGARQWTGTRSDRDTGGSAPVDVFNVRPIDAEQPLPVWRWWLLAGIACLAGETLLAGWRGRPASQSALATGKDA